ncbi:heparinase II/III domain-containing protein [Halobaculum sp. EA56]|uniref:heparinase II/III domain-containing protein n=1 Tax=Halobaculum sp. EA56 TaxID=3421648 RepID=UPI003EB9D0EE
MFDRWTNPKELSLFYHTGINLHPRQITGMVDRKLRHAIVPNLPVDIDDWYERKIPRNTQPDSVVVTQNLEVLRASLCSDLRTTYQQKLSELSNGTLSMLGQSFEIGKTASFDWDHDTIASFPPLWRLHLHALEPVNWLVCGYTVEDCPEEILHAIRQLLQSWDDNIAIGGAQYLRRDWTPHAVSLRVLRLCRLYAWLQDSLTTFADQVPQIAFKNALFLENHVEYDVGGNHLIENGAALLMAGSLFREYGRRWRKKGISILEKCAVDQFLADGGHFERSPMYHILVLQRYLTAVDLLSATGDDPPESIKQTAVNATRFLRSLTPPDERIPLLNDAVFDEFLPLTDCLRYAEKVGVATESTGRRQQSLDTSGYHWLGNGENRVLVDGGPVGPSHLPGHSHNDMLSIMLWINGARILTDTGAYDYVPDTTRTYVRGVQAHNTVQVGEYEPIPIGGQYLMGRRCTPQSRISRDDGHDHFAGWYERRKYLRSAYRHQRDILSGHGWWIVVDEFDGAPTETLTSYLHFHPEIDLHSDGSEYRFQRTDAAASGVIRPLGTETVTRTTSPYFPRFGDRVERPVLRCRYDQTAECTGFIITAGRDPDIAVKSRTDGFVVSMEDQHYNFDRLVSKNGQQPST